MHKRRVRLVTVQKLMLIQLKLLNMQKLVHCNYLQSVLLCTSVFYGTDYAKYFPLLIYKTAFVGQ